MRCGLFDFSRFFSLINTFLRPGCLVWEFWRNFALIEEQVLPGNQRKDVLVQALWNRWYRLLKLKLVTIKAGSQNTECKVKKIFWLGSFLPYLATSLGISSYKDNTANCHRPFQNADLPGIVRYPSNREHWTHRNFPENKRKNLQKFCHSIGQNFEVIEVEKKKQKTSN